MENRNYNLRQRPSVFNQSSLSVSTVITTATGSSSSTLVLSSVMDSTVRSTPAGPELTQTPTTAYPASSGLDKTPTLSF